MEQSCGTKPLTSGIWRYLQVDNVRTDVNCKTPGWSQRNDRYGDMSGVRSTVRAGVKETNSSQTSSEIPQSFTQVDFYCSVWLFAKALAVFPALSPCQFLLLPKLSTSKWPVSQYLFLSIETHCLSAVIKAQALITIYVNEFQTYGFQIPNAYLTYLLGFNHIKPKPNSPNWWSVSPNLFHPVIRLSFWISQTKAIIFITHHLKIFFKTLPPWCYEYIQHLVSYLLYFIYMRDFQLVIGAILICNMHCAGTCRGE